MKPLFSHIFILLSLWALPLRAQSFGERFLDAFTSPADWGVAEPAQPGDLIFNELMPYVTGDRSRFIELYNNSPKILDLTSIAIANLEPRGDISHVHNLAPDQLMLPYSYAVLAPDTGLIGCPQGLNPEALYIETALPLFSSVSHTLVLIDRASGEQLDLVTYDLKWHSPAIADRHNVSLERIDPRRDTQDSLNWHSAATTAGYQTAGFRNSQALANTRLEGIEYFAVENTTFSPDNDGFRDNLILHYDLPEEGYLLRATVYTRTGDQISTPYNILLPKQGRLTYDGRDPNSNQTIETGLYILRLEAAKAGRPTIQKNIVFIKAK